MLRWIRDHWPFAGRDREAARLHIERIDPLPFPHFTCDDVLTAGELRDLNRYWPTNLPEETLDSGYRVLPLTNPKKTQDFTKEQHKFWHHFVETVCNPIIGEVFNAYYPWVFQKFGNRIPYIQATMVAATQFDSHAVSAGIHVHRHDPTWISTILIHVDDGENSLAEFRGNSVVGFKDHQRESDYSDETFARLASVKPHDYVDGLTLLKHYSFKPGRLFSFFETPISYHASRTTKPGVNAIGDRRMLRMHVEAPRELTQQLYGVGHKEFYQMQYLADGKADSRIATWMKRDMHDVFVASDSVRLGSQLSRSKIPVLAPRTDWPS